MRIGFTIIYNGLHHLLHNDYAKKMVGLFDCWIVVEGAAAPNGSTFWCMPLENKISTDGTRGRLLELGPHSPVIILGNELGWHSKDDMVNAAVRNPIVKRMQEKAQSRFEYVFLWQVDIDEQWTASQMDEAEKELIDNNGNCGCFLANHYVGKNLVAKGQWGEGKGSPDNPLEFAYRRLWVWEGQQFRTHEPPALNTGNGKEVLLSQRFNHYSYYFEKDVIFKSKYYKDYEDIHTCWLALQKETVFPQPVSCLIGGFWGSTDTVIEKMEA
jgi:hypothetical protein